MSGCSSPRSLARLAKRGILSNWALLEALLIDGLTFEGSTYCMDGAILAVVNLNRRSDWAQEEGSIAAPVYGNLDVRYAVLTESEKSIRCTVQESRFDSWNA